MGRIHSNPYIQGSTVFCDNFRETENLGEAHGHLRRGDIVGVTGYPGEYYCDYEYDQM